MKAHLDIQHDGNVGTDGRTRMTFDENSIAHLMSILTDLYSDPEMAVIREYATNAWDAHRAAGNDAPIEVFLPSNLNPIYRVKDRGIGMSVDEISNFFSKYGASSKRDTDNEVGMLGLGCKSALSYTSQFTLVSVKGGVQATVLVTREADGAGAVQIMDTTTTDKPNGVEVRIPVKNVANFNFRAEEFFYYWDPGTVLVDGYSPRCIWTETTADAAKVVDPDIRIVMGYNKSRVVMGNVAYPVDYTYSLTGSRDTSVVVRVPIGAVNFVPSREALQYTKRTIEVMDEVKKFIAESIIRAAQDDVAASSSPWEAVARAANWRDSYSRMNNLLKYDGIQVPRGFDFTSDSTFAWDAGDTETPAYKVAHFGPREALKNVYVTGHTMKYVTGLTKAKLNMWADAHPDMLSNYGAVKFVMIGGLFRGREWVDPQRVLDFKKDVYPIEVPKENLPAPRPSTRGKFRVLNPSRDTYLWVDALDAHTLLTGTKMWTWVLVDQAEYRRSTVAWIGEKLGVSVVAIPRKEVQKFLANQPMVHLSTFIGAEARRWVKNLTSMQVFSLNDDGAVSESGITRLKRGTILDPNLNDIRERIAALPDRYRLRTERDALVAACNAFCKKMPDLPKSSFRDEIKAAVRPYPLLSHCSYTRYSGMGPDRVEAEAMADYVNSIYLLHSQLNLHPQTY